MQSERIRERIAQFGGKLYLEFGGKLFDDYHASRVLPGFAPDNKIRMLLAAEGAGGDRHRHQRQRHRKEQAPRRPRHHLRRRRHAAGRRLSRVRPLRRQHRADAVYRPAFGRHLSSTGCRRWASRSTACTGFPTIPPTFPGDRQRRRLWQKRLYRDHALARRRHRTRPGQRQDGDLPVPALSRAPARRARGLREVRDLPDLEPAAEAPGEPRLRGRHRRPERREHDRPLPPRGLWRHHGQLQPRHRDLPRAARHLRAHLRRMPLQEPDGHGREHGRLRHRRRRSLPRGVEAGGRSPLLTTPPACAGWVWRRTRKSTSSSC